MNKIFKDAAQKNVGCFLVYANATDNKLYLDADLTAGKEAKQAEIEDAFLKSTLVIVDGDDNYLKPLYINANKVYTCALATTTVTITEWTAVAPA